MRRLHIREWLPRALTLFGLLSVALLCVSDASAVGPTDTTIQNRFGGIQVTQPTTTNGGYATVGSRAVATSSIGSAAQSSFRGDVLALLGGRYDNSTQSIYSAFNADVHMMTAGQAMGFSEWVTGYGKGNTMGLSSVLSCWGGGEIEVGTDSIPECSPVGEVISIWGNVVFEGTVTGSPATNATTISYTPVANDNVLGKRLVLNKNHTYSTGTVTSITGGDVVLSGSSLLSLIASGGQSNPTKGWYFKVGSTQDYYTPPCSGDDVEIGGKCVGHWYHVIALDDNTHLRLGMYYDTVGLMAPAGQTYMLMQGAEPTDVDQANHAISIPSGNGFSWANGDTLYSPPNHWMRQTGAIIQVSHPYKDLEGPVENSGNSSWGLYVRNDGPGPMTAGLYLSGSAGGGYVGSPAGSGGFRRGIVLGNWQTSGYRGIDMNGGVNGVSIVANWTDAAIALPESDGTNNGITFGNAAKVLYDGTQLKLDPSSGKTLEIDRGVKPDGSGLKHKRVTTGSISASTTSTVTVSWGTAFADGSYTPTCNVADSSGANLQVVNIDNVVAASFDVRVKNGDSGGAHTGTLNCVALHD